MRDEGRDRASERPKPTGEEGCRRDPVDIVVTVDEDPLAVPYRTSDTIRGFGSIGKECRIAQLVHPRPKESLGVFRLESSTDCEHCAHRLR
jgi:hypothetical protein